MNNERYNNDEHNDFEKVARLDAVRALEQNKRVNRIRQNINLLERELQEELQNLESVIKGISERENMPEYQRAKDLFDQGMRFHMMDDDDNGVTFFYTSDINIAPVETIVDDSVSNSVSRVDLLEKLNQEYGEKVVSYLMEITDES